MFENEKLSPPVNLKHRIIGAVILVSAAVIFLPMIFSEREPPAELKAIGEIPGKGETPATPAPSTAAEYAPPVPVPEVAAVAPEKALASEKAPAKTAPAVAIPARGWAVQVGVFANAANAAKLADKLKGQGHRVLTDNIVQGGEKRVRLRVGPFADKAAAQQAQAKIQKAHGITGAVQAYP
jgi:DedD protein